MKPESPPAARRRWPWLLAAVLLLVALAAAAWWRARGHDFVYAQIRPGDARLLAELEIPEPPRSEHLVADLRRIAEELPDRHVAFERAFDPVALAARIAELEAAAPTLSPAQIQLALVEVIGLGGPGTGHTLVPPVQRGLDWRLTGIEAYLFDDGLFVTAAEREELAGARIVSVGGVESPRVFERLAPYVSADNDSTLRLRIPRLLGFAEPLAAAGLAGVDGRLELELEQDGERRRLSVEPFALTSLRGLRWARRRMAPVGETWSPAETRPRSSNYSLDYHSDDATLWLELNAIRNQPGGESLAELAERLARMAGERPVERFVIDLRSNGGGNNRLAKPLVETIAGHPVLDRPGVLFALIGRRTFSAAGNLTTALERRTRVTFAGEESGFRPNHFGDSVPLLLPATGIIARVASRYWQDDLPGVERASIVPEVRVPITSRDHFSGVDPATAALVGVSPPAGREAAEPLPPDLAGSYLLSPHHRVRLVDSGDGPRLEIDTTELFASTPLRPDGPGRLAAALDGVGLSVEDAGSLRLRWKGRVFELTPVDAGHRLPIELLRENRVDEALAAFRAAAGSVPVGSELELAINAEGYRLVGDDRTDAAADVFLLNCELFPSSANVWDSLGDALSEDGRPGEAAEAYRRALDVDPGFEHARQRLAELGASPAD